MAFRALGQEKSSAREPVCIALLLLSYSTADPVLPQELLQLVEPGRAQALEEYNAVFLKEHTYFASRYRIVKVNVDALLERRDVSITPFTDMRR